MPHYTVIIPAYNEAKNLPATLASVRSAVTALGRPAEIIVVDNNSSDDTSTVARTHGATHVVFEPHNQIARARNAGAARASSPFLVFLDADTFLPGKLLATALNALDSGNHTGGGARVVTDRPFPPAFQFVLSSWEHVSKLFSYAAGSFLFCRRDAFQDVGGFPETVYAGEEVHLSMSLKRWSRHHGKYFTVIPDPPVVTSARKADWFSPLQLLAQIIVGLIPFATRSRALCWIWYHRPESTTPTPGTAES